MGGIQNLFHEQNFFSGKVHEDITSRLQRLLSEVVVHAFSFHAELLTLLLPILASGHRYGIMVLVLLCEYGINVGIPHVHCIKNCILLSCVAVIFLIGNAYHSPAKVGAWKDLQSLSPFLHAVESVP